LRALIVDDERLARTELRRLLAAHPEIEVIAEARDVNEALDEIPSAKPELLFLDIKMPGGSGFDLLEQLDSVPHVIFTTAFDEYALKAFEVNALDYLLKPIVPERLAAAVQKAIGASQKAATPVAADQKIFLKDGERCWFVALRDIVLLESEGNYTRVFFDHHRPLILRSLNSLEERLDPALFYRASRKHILNLQAITGVEPTVAGGLNVSLKGGLQAEMSRRRATEFRQAMSL
jgi:two-component system LytT family response regulator